MMGWGSDSGWSGNGAGYVVMMVAMVLFWGLVIAAIVWVLRRPSTDDRSGGGMVEAHRSAQQVLAERFARGEIDESEFTVSSTGFDGGIQAMKETVDASTEEVPGRAA